jgi:hypothetical protein
LRLNPNGNIAIARKGLTASEFSLSRCGFLQAASFGTVGAALGA